jgi:hypothetical protein
MWMASICTSAPAINAGRAPLRGNESDGVGDHWWQKLTAAAYMAHQLRDPVGGIGKPYGW